MNKQIITLLIVLTSSAHAGGVPITGNQKTDRVLNYGALGGLIGAIIGHNVGGDPDENRDIGAAIGAIGVARDAVTHVGTDGPGVSFHAGNEVHEPDNQIVGTGHRDLEILRRVNALELIERRSQEIRRDLRVLEENREIRVAMNTGTGGDPAVLQLDPPAFRLVFRLKLSDAIAFFQTLLELREYRRAGTHGLRDAPENDG